MALIPCPECEREVSSHAAVCPGCGFPLAEALHESLAELTGEEASRPFRHQAAAHNLKAWADRYSRRAELEEKPSRSRVALERTAKVAMWLLVVVVVGLQLVWVTSAIQR